MTTARILALKATLTADGGWSLDLSEPVLARALCHLDNAYWIPDVEAHGQIAKTNKTSQTAFRGFGGPQGVFVIEDILGRCAARSVSTPRSCAERNFYAARADDPVRPAGSARRTDRGHLVRSCWKLGLRAAGVHAIEAFNAAARTVKRGLAITPVKFGISFNVAAFNQAGALVHVYKDGSVLINHGGIEMGQGLHTKMIQVAATALGVPLDFGAPRADAHRQGAEHLRHGGQHGRRSERRRRQERLRPDPRTDGGRGRRHPRFPRGATCASLAARSLLRACTARSLTFAEVAKVACLRSVFSCQRPGTTAPKACTGTPTHAFGSPFKYFTYGAAAAEVEVDGFTGAYRTRRVDIVQDVGDSLSPIIDIGQVEGGFVQGAGWLTLEDLRWDISDGPGRGRLLTQAASTYKLPSFSEMPEEFNVYLFERAHEDSAIYGSKAVGEPPLMLAFSVREALRQAAPLRPGRAASSCALAGDARGRVHGDPLTARRCRAATGGHRPGCCDRAHDLPPLVAPIPERIHGLARRRRRDFARGASPA